MTKPIILFFAALVRRHLETWSVTDVSFRAIADNLEDVPNKGSGGCKIQNPAVACEFLEILDCVSKCLGNDYCQSL